MKELLEWLAVSYDKTITCTISGTLFSTTFTIIEPKVIIRNNIVFINGDGIDELYFNEKLSVSSWTDGMTVYYDITVSEDITITLW